MSYIIDRLILIWISFMVLMQMCTMRDIVILGLSAVVFAGLSYYFDAKYVSVGFSWVYIGLSLPFPILICIAPVVMYELFRWKRYVEMVLLVVVSGVGLRRLEDITPLAFLLVIFGGLLALILYWRSNENDKLHEMIKHIRDDSEERNMLLAEKNKHLIEKQDQEVYVATLKERNRIAREIHDNVGHMITRSILQMGALMTINKEEPLHGQLESVKNNLDVAMNNIRESVHDLHDESVDMKQAITDMICDLDGKFNCKLDYDAGKNIDRKYKYAIIGIVKEAISNILKYSKSDRVDIVIREHPGMYQLVIHDYDDVAKTKAISHNSNQEKTFNLAKKSGEGIGLQNMRDRVEALKGNIVIDREQGFKIFVTLPR
ncbi:MAG: sensor histidine kinase [Lachnospiraceae bacterium]|nr:sensor histidine kinase [Lachnospiraceae bacterium]